MIKFLSEMQSDQARISAGKLLCGGRAGEVSCLRSHPQKDGQWHPQIDLGGPPLPPGKLPVDLSIRL